MTNKLPPMPDGCGLSNYYSQEQMQAYGQECRDAALEEVAMVCDTEANDANSAKRKPLLSAQGTVLYEGMWGGAVNCAAAIRGLK
jgi:hypothetical protein